MSLRRAAIPIVLTAAIGVTAHSHVAAAADSADSGPPIVTISVPEALSAQAELGQKTYEANCVSCHGRNAAGRDGVAPPLVHVLYEPGHHDDESFQRAVARGVRTHHWRFGDMPPVEGLTQDDVAAIVAYVRELQRANGIW